MHDSGDHCLIQRYLDGDDTAFRQLYDRYQVYVGRVIASAVSDAEERNDCAQETWLHVLRGLPSYRGQARFPVWLWKVARNVVTERGRAHGRWERKRTVSAKSQSVVVHELLERMSVYDAISRIPNGMRAVLLLRLEGYRHADIAAQLAITEGTAKSQLAKARTRMRVLLG